MIAHTRLFSLFTKLKIQFYLKVKESWWNQVPSVIMHILKLLITKVGLQGKVSNLKSDHFKNCWHGFLSCYYHPCFEWNIQYTISRSGSIQRSHQNVFVSNNEAELVYLPRCSCRYRKYLRSRINCDRVLECMTLPIRHGLFIYLFFHSFQVIKNIANRGNEWDKNSPVWTNKRYLSDIYNELKRNFLKEQQ